MNNAQKEFLETGYFQLNEQQARAVGFKGLKLTDKAKQRYEQCKLNNDESNFELCDTDVVIMMSNKINK